MQEVIGSTPIFSTSSINKPDSQPDGDESGFYFAKTLTDSVTCLANSKNMQIPDRLYTEPSLYKGKQVKVIPKGSNKAIEQAKQTWYIDFSFYNHIDGKMRRFRITKDGNRIKDPVTKLNYFNNLLAAYKELLEGGYNPCDERSNEKMKKTIISLTLDEAKQKFDEYQQGKGSRKKTIQTYTSKLAMFIEHFGAHRKVNEVTDYDITSFLNQAEREKEWTGVTYNLARIVLNNFFKYLTVNRYVASNPVSGIETRKELKTELHTVFSDEDFIKIMKWLKEHDPYCLFFVKMIYYTCIRPKELRQLQLKHIDIKSNTITVPANIAKNKKALPVHIDEALMKELEQLQLSQYPETYYLLGSTSKIVGKQQIGENTPYYRFQRCLKELGLVDKNYTMYSFKHLSNKKKALNGWSLAEICKANRHSSLVETETYLKDLLKDVQITKSIPPI